MEAMNQSDMQNRVELYARVSGLVQGVGFRYFVVRQATNLGLRGYARNESSDAVEVVAQGSRGALERLLASLHQGPSAAEVREVQTVWRALTEHFSGFHVRY